ncbi:PepSY domain-containing protein [Aestuariibacter halophilus]|uniref:PepSY domain-containing protein n=1 Tax=Fluctibacter halophilus TaxID=226011 RepID=A0ABS8G5W7_9ALTE|nr:PepSY domain-containing protein [Aestuariibacter halophilus]MCC2615255.1 PepSY domain-containing protein [Aestuariibacter halophilus]
MRTLIYPLIAAFLLSSAMAFAQSKDDKDIDRAQAARKAQQQLNGRVLKVNNDKHKYRVKVLQKSGRVVSVDVDKRSGKVSQPKKDKDR